MENVAFKVRGVGKLRTDWVGMNSAIEESPQFRRVSVGVHLRYVVQYSGDDDDSDIGKMRGEEDRGWVWHTDGERGVAYVGDVIIEVLDGAHVGVAISRDKVEKIQDLCENGTHVVWDDNMLAFGVVLAPHSV